MRGELSIKMKAWLGHVRAASESGQSLRSYAAAQGVSAAAMYQAKSLLMKSGAWPRASRPISAARVKASAAMRGRSADAGFVPVQILATASASCRLRHVSGWSIECDALPAASWLLALVQGGVHVAA